MTKQIIFSNVKILVFLIMSYKITKVLHTALKELGLHLLAYKLEIMHPKILINDL